MKWSHKILVGIAGSELAVMNHSGHFPFEEEPAEFRRCCRRLRAAPGGSAMTYSPEAIAALGGHGVDVVDALRRRRMHREFTDRPVPRPVLSYLAWAAGRAQMARPGARVIVVVNDPRA
jgi:hypothetical protein